jgi:hypothetical protein
MKLAQTALMKRCAMVIPVLYWMLECSTCGARRIVHDSYLGFADTGESDSDSADSWPAPGAGYGGLPLPERYGCRSGCAGAMRAIGSVSSADDETVWLENPHRAAPMDEKLREEWVRLIREADLLDS